MTPAQNELLRSLPSVASLLAHQEVIEWLHGLPRSSVLTSLQEAVEAMRHEIISGKIREPVDPNDVLARAEQALFEASIPSLRKVINATGIVLHTGLGRAPLCDAATEAIVDGVSGYCNLEYDLDTGSRGRRHVHVVDHLRTITGAEAALVVNNNAAATLLILQTFAAGREVIVSRGQLIEIGGSFRMPDIMRASGAELREVGTTNRTHASDYESAIGDATAMLMRVHPSNYRVVGFTRSVPIATMADIAHRYDLLAVDDLGSGALFDTQAMGMPDEPSVQDSLAAGADLVCFSGDKLLGGPQCGIILGRGDLMDRIEANPLMRTYRVGKLTLLALEATLRSFLDPQEAAKSVPALAMLRSTPEQLAKRARTLCEMLERTVGARQFLVCSDVGYAGGGSMPDRELQTVVVQWRPDGCSVDAVAAALRGADVPVIARIRDGAICFDLRTVPESEFETLVTTVQSAVWDEHGDETDE